MKLLTNPITYLALAIAVLAGAILFTPAVALDQLGSGLLQIVPAAIIGVLLLFAFMLAFKNWRIFSSAKDAKEEAKTAFQRVSQDPLATAIYMGAAILAIAQIINGAMS